VNRETETSGEKKPWRLKPTYIPRLMPVGMIIILLAILIPVLREKKPGVAVLPPVDPPLAMKYYATGYPASDSLMNDALRSFGRKDYEAAARLLSKVQFYWSVQLREGKVKAYPEDLRFYLGLALPGPPGPRRPLPCGGIEGEAVRGEIRVVPRPRLRRAGRYRRHARDAREDREDRRRACGGSRGHAEVADVAPLTAVPESSMFPLDPGAIAEKESI
jgi:hypothetical protein